MLAATECPVFRYALEQVSNVTLSEKMVVNEKIMPVKIGSHDLISIQLTLKIFVCVMEFVGVHMIQFLHPIIS